MSYMHGNESDRSFTEIWKSREERITALAEQHLTDYNGALPPLGIVRNATHALPRISRHQERSTLLPPACLLMYSC